MKIVSDKSLRVTTLGGTAVLFEAGVVREISDEIGLIAIQMGAKEYNKKYVEEVNAEVAVFEELTIEAELAVEVTSTPSPAVTPGLVTMLEKMMDEGDPKNFKTDCFPKASAVSKAMGVTIGTDEREAAWESILNS